MGGQLEAICLRSRAPPPANDCGPTHDRAVQLGLNAGLTQQQAEEPAPSRATHLVTTLAAYARNVELASYDMVTYLCYDGSTVWKKGNRNEPPPEAAVQNIPGHRPVGHHAA